MKTRSLSFLCVLILFFSPQRAPAQSGSSAVSGNIAQDLKTFVETPAIPGYEGALAAKIQVQLRSYAPKIDSLGDVIVSLGSGAPHRLLVTPMDEPGYVVSRVADDGYLQLQRLPQFGLLPLFNRLYAAQPVRIQTASGQWIDGVVAGLSVHLLPGRRHPPDPGDIANMYVDLGAQTAGQVQAAGADVLDPVAVDRTVYEMGDGQWTAAAIGDRFGDAALVEVLRRLDVAKLNGTLTVAFVTRQWAGARGLERLLDRQKPDELIYIGRLLAGGHPFAQPPVWRFPRLQPGSGVIVASAGAAAAADAPLTGLAADLKRLADQRHIPMAEDYSAPVMPRSYLPSPPLPARFAHLGIATAWPSTPAEVIDTHDLANLTALLEYYLEGASQQPVFPPARDIAEPLPPPRPAVAPTPEEIVKELVQTYGVSEHEAAVREAIHHLLPAWAQTTTDRAGNLILRFASAPASVRTPSILFVAHMDEIGYEVISVLPDGTLAVESEGGGLPYYYAGHAVFVHTTQGIRPGVMELPAGWNQPAFKWPRGRQASYRVDVGARSPAEVSALGIRTGDSITIPKQYRPLLGTRASARSFDDRVGDAALISAVWALGPRLTARNVTFVWSTGEELGLVGAAAAAKRLASEGRTPDYVFAIDTFVSSDSPLESPRFADARLGQGFVVRAVDNSNIVPRRLVKRVLTIARARQIPAQYGVTGGGNDGAAFLRYGAVDVALGWPLRYSHSPSEVIDTRDLDGLARIVAVIAQSW